MHLIALALIACLAQDIYVNQVLAMAYWAILVIGWWSRKYIRWPLIAMSIYLGLQSLLLPISPELGYFAPKEFILWILLFFANHVIKFNFGHPCIIPMAIALTLVGWPPFYNTSLNLAFLVTISATAPLWQLALVAGMILIKPSGLSAPLMFIAVALCRCKRWRWTYASVAATATAWLIWLEPRMLTAKLDSEDRFHFWRETANYFMAKQDFWIGSGLGTFILFGKKIQEVNHWSMESLWMSAHNDYLQWLFETGLIGACLGVWLLSDALFALRDGDRITLLALLVLMLGNFPMDVPAFEFVLAGLILKANRRQSY